MDLLDLRGLGPATKEKLALAGIRTVDDLARVRDIGVVSDWSGLSQAKLAELVAEAMKANQPRPVAESARAVWESLSRLGRTLAASVPVRGSRST